MFRRRYGEAMRKVLKATGMQGPDRQQRPQITPMPAIAINIKPGERKDPGQLSPRRAGQPDQPEPRDHVRRRLQPAVLAQNEIADAVSHRICPCHSRQRPGAGQYERLTEDRQGHACVTRLSTGAAAVIECVMILPIGFLFS